MIIKKYFQEIQIRQVLWIILILGLAQALLTPIARDEAYYWMFANHLDWGYFDHPPMVALMAAIGMFVLPGVFGVRFMTVLVMTATAWLIWRLIPAEDRKQSQAPLFFLLLLLSNPLFTVYSFTTTPDVPLFFFTALYLLAFRRFEKENNFLSAILLGGVMAGLIYSKYHGILVILFSLAARPKLLIQPRYYLAGLTGILLYLPHLYWQYQHDFVSFEYHLFYRSVSFAWKNVIMYFVNLLLVLNPFIFPLFLIRFFKRTNKEIESRQFNFLLWGFLIFFAFTASRGHVEPHWIAAALIPMVIYTLHYLLRNQAIEKYFRKVAWFSVIVFLILRIVIILPLPIESEYHSRRSNYYEQVKEVAAGKPVVYVNSYTDAARYSFYTGDPCFSYNFISYRKNQYDLLDMTKEFHNQDVMMALTVNLKRYDSTTFDNGEWFYYKHYDGMPLINQLKIEILDYQQDVTKGDTIELTFELTNPYDFDVEVFREPYIIYWEIFFFDLTKERVGGVSLMGVPLKVIEANSKVRLNGRFVAGMEPGEYTIGASIHPATIFPLSASKRTYPIVIRPSP